MTVPRSRGPPKSFLARKSEKKCFTKRVGLPSETLGQSLSTGREVAGERQWDLLDGAETLTKTKLACG
jgi:hypothetical protein